LQERPQFNLFRNYFTKAMAKQYKYLDSFIDEQRANAMYSFATEDLHSQLGVSENALKKTLQQLKNLESVVMIWRGFYAWIQYPHQFVCQCPI